MQGYNGAAVGKGRQLAKTELEKLKLAELTTREAVMEAARMFVIHASLWLALLILLAMTSLSHSHLGSVTDRLSILNTHLGGTAPRTWFHR